jgi:hypothetical protein
MSMVTFVDGSTKAGLPTVLRSSGAEVFQILAQQ